MTFFDLEIRGDSFKVVSCFEALNKRALLKILETDFRLLTGAGTAGTRKVYKQSTTGNRVVFSQQGVFKSWLTYPASGDTLLASSGKSTIADPVIITCKNYESGFPARIKIENPVIGMKMSLKLLKR